MDLIPACVGKINFKYLIEHNVPKVVAVKSGYCNDLHFTTKLNATFYCLQPCVIG